VTAEHVITPDDRCPCGEPQEGSGYCSYECFSKFEMGSIVEPAPEMPRPPAVEALGAVEPSNADTGRGTGVREAHERSEAVELVPGVWISSASPADHDRAAAASLRRIAEHRLNTAPDAIAYARAEGIAEAARLLDRVADDEGES
jgi:hypothetical protein